MQYPALNKKSLTKYLYSLNLGCYFRVATYQRYAKIGSIRFYPAVNTAMRSRRDKSGHNKEINRSHFIPYEEHNPLAYTTAQMQVDMCCRCCIAQKTYFSLFCGSVACLICQGSATLTAGAPPHLSSQLEGSLVGLATRVKNRYYGSSRLLQELFTLVFFLFQPFPLTYIRGNHRERERALQQQWG